MSTKIRGWALAPKVPLRIRSLLLLATPQSKCKAFKIQWFWELYVPSLLSKPHLVMGFLHEATWWKASLLLSKTTGLYLKESPKRVMKWKTTAVFLGKLVLEGRRKTDMPGLGLDADASSHLHLSTTWLVSQYYPHLPGGEANLEKKKARSHSKCLAERGLKPRYFNDLFIIPQLLLKMAY